MLQNPHRSQPEVHRVAYKTWHRADWRKKLAQHGPSSRISAKKLAQRSLSTGTSAKKFAQHAQKHRIWGVLSALGEYFRAYTITQRRRAKFFAPK